MPTLKNAWYTPAFRGFALALAALAPAQAVVVRSEPGLAGATITQILAQVAGGNHPSVVSLNVDGALYGGAYLGRTRDGKAGKVLLCGHAFTAGPDSGERLEDPGITLWFGAEGQVGPVRAQGFRVHPQFRLYDINTAHRQRGEDLPRVTNYVNDLALVFFAATPEVMDGLAKAGVQPAVPYDQPGFQAPLQEAELAGTGEFGTHASPVRTWDRRVYGGGTYVSPEPGPEGEPLLVHRYLPVPAHHGEESKEDGRWDRFQLLPGRLEAFVPGGKGPAFVLATHPNQAICADGDPGAPLFVRFRGVSMLAAVYSHGILEPYDIPGIGEHTPVVCQQFTPLVGHGAWIASDGERIAEPEAKETPGSPDPGTPPKAVPLTFTPPAGWQPPSDRVAAERLAFHTSPSPRREAADELQPDPNPLALPRPDPAGFPSLKPVRQPALGRQAGSRPMAFGKGALRPAEAAGAAARPGAVAARRPVPVPARAQGPVPRDQAAGAGKAIPAPAKPGGAAAPRGLVAARRQGGPPARAGKAGAKDRGAAAGKQGLAPATQATGAGDTRRPVVSRTWKPVGKS